ncbi:MAG: hypothetical protein HY756_08025 [Nitrospirae bacterium]|nr:hypothetical protein [Nitrospirota bacterium]
MLKKATINITLGIQGPILCKATAPSSWGIDATFDRDYKGIPYIDRSHIKGKLKEALKELGTDEANLYRWLGEEHSDGGMLIISDFYCVDSPTAVRYDNRLTRTKRDRVRGVVDDTALLSMENAFPLKNMPYNWNGCIEFIADDNSIQGIYTEIVAGLKWITAVGAEKTVGFGKIVSVESEEPKIEDLSFPDPLPTANPPEEWFTVTIEAEDPLLIGGVQRAANYRESESIIPGGMIKGALAATLNRLCGVDKVSTSINKENTKVSEHYKALSEHFSKIRFTHAFPTTGDTRPVVIPYSAVAEGNNFYDVALNEGVKLVNDKAPVFQTDWKNYPDNFGWAIPRCIAKTRTGIDGNLRRAEDNMMFTYQYVCPVDSKNNKIIWYGLVHLPNDDRGALHTELIDAVQRITRMGKRRSKVKVSITPGKCGHAQIENGAIAKDSVVIVSLQSDALMVNPYDMLKKQQTAKELHKLYWGIASGNSMEMVRFFAHQKLLGGYIVRKHGGKYYPFSLTGAGSVFVLKVSNENTAKGKIDEWKTNGLLLPEWAKTTYKKHGKELWETCPFVQENGYGEVMVNLKWHFANRIDNAGGAK